LEGWEIPNTPTSIPNLKSARSAAASDLVDAQVESVNIVGYITKTLTEKNNMVGLNFGKVGDGGAIPIVDLVPKDQPGLNVGASVATSDNIQVLVGTGYTTYYLCNGNIGKGGAYVPAADGWVKGGEAAVTTDTIPVGGAFWFISQSAAADNPVNLTLAGQVATDVSLTKSIQPGLNMIANGYATDLAFANPDTGLSVGTKGTSVATSDNIQVLVGTGYTTYYFCNGNIGKGGAYVPAADGWVKGGEAAVTTDVVPAGASAWYINRADTAFDWVAPRPYSL
jgi:hypothetical protein